MNQKEDVIILTLGFKATTKRSSLCDLVYVKKFL